MQIASPADARRWIIWSIAALVVLLILGLGVVNAVVLPGCSACHRGGDFRAASAASPHARVDCRSCHVPSGTFGRLRFALRQPLHMFVPVASRNVRDAAAVPDSRCLRCHNEVETSVVTANGIRISHSSCAAGAACTDCHSATAHGAATSSVRTYEMDLCLPCHVANGRTACDLCHEGRDRADRIKSSTFAITHGPQWRATHGMGDSSTCSVCHEQDGCADCHGPGVPHDEPFVQVHADYATQADAQCLDCHQESFCNACHGTPMPHAPQFTPAHAKIAAKEPAVCTRCHIESDCTTCHLKHVHPGGAIGAAPSGGGS